MWNVGPDHSKLSISEDKYNNSVNQDMIKVMGHKSILSLLAASYASSTWKKLNSAIHSITEYTDSLEEGEGLKWPIASKILEGSISWAVERGLKANTIEQYINSLETIHKLRNIDSSTCTKFTIGRLIKGAKNREQYIQAPKHTRKVMSL